MSYDISVGNKSFNYTFNLWKLFREHFPKFDGDREDGLLSLDGLTGKSALERISLFWVSVESERLRLWDVESIGEPKMSEKYDAPNGWGSLIGALILVGQIQAECASRPRCIVRVSA